MSSCPQCGRKLPGEALFCPQDGRAVGEGAGTAFRRFRHPLILTNGRPCGSFDELLKAILDDWDMGRDLLSQGDLEQFLEGIGRADLARLATEAAQIPDIDLGLDELMRALPGTILRPAELVVFPASVELGRVHLGETRTLEFTLLNTGMGLLGGSARSRVPWLVLGENELTFERFAFHDEKTLRVRMRGADLRAGPRQVEGEILVETSGGRQVLRIAADVPATPFAEGVLAGARSPRQLAQKARANPRGASRLFESGAVARWYAANGWPYPVEGDPAPGVASVQQFFDALGLSRPPRLVLAESSVTVEAAPGTALRRTIRLSTPDKRPLYARAVSDRSWLQVRGVDLDGTAAVIHLAIPLVPDWPGEETTATVTIHANCRQKLRVPVVLRIIGPRRPAPEAPKIVSSRHPPPPRRYGMLLALSLLAAGLLGAFLLSPAHPPPVPKPEPQASKKRQPPVISSTRNSERGT